MKTICGREIAALLQVMRSKVFYAYFFLRIKNLTCKCAAIWDSQNVPLFQRYEEICRLAVFYLFWLFLIFAMSS